MKGKHSKRTSKTDWKRIDALADSEIDTSDIAPLSRDFFKNAVLRKPARLVKTTIKVDAETLSWFRAQGDCSRRLNAALRLYAAAHRV